MGIFNLFKRKQKTSEQVIEHIKEDYVDPETGEVTKSSIEYNNANERFLKLADTSCAMILHQGGKIEIVFTRLYDKENQRVSLEEETLMAIGIFMKQPGFAEMLRHEFHQIAMNDITILTETGETDE
jgi:hypothetical protein